MRKYPYLTLIIALLALLVASCRKEPEVNIEEFEITKETVTARATSATIMGTYAFTGKINGIEVCVADNEYLTNAETYPTVLDDKSFTAELTGLKVATTYHYCYSVDYGFSKPYKTETKSFTTQSEAPTVATLEALPLGEASFRVKCEVMADGGLEVTERGICWNTYGDPTLDDEVMKHANGGLGQYTILLENLDLAPYYYVRAYARNATGVGFGEVLELSTSVPVELPSVTTVEVSGVTSTGASCLCNVSSDGGAEVTERGACWGTGQAPTVSGSHANSGTGTGPYTVYLTGLTANTSYYVRAYAKNSNGISYGEAKRFITLEDLPVVITGSVTDVTATTAKCRGTVTNQGASAVTERGVCWSTGHHPTISGSHATSGTGTGSFTANMTGLTIGMTYYVRAYAKNSAGTSYGSEVSFTTIVDAPTGAIDGLFSVSATQQVFFSQGNLQYRASTNTWRFAENQWDYVGSRRPKHGIPGGTVPESDNGFIGSTYSGWIDLFGWGTSGYDHGAVCYQPWSTIQTNSDYYAYGNCHYNLFDQTGKADWGYNAISNGGNTTNTWHTLTRLEWEYVFNTRSTNSGIRYAKARVNNVNGVILLPDDWSSSYYTLSNTNQSGTSYSSNTITVTQWNTLEQHGAVFLPAAGYRLGASVSDVGSFGGYWSASYYGSSRAWLVKFAGSGFAYDGLCLYYDYHRSSGRSVRLVSAAQWLSLVKK